MYLHISSQPTQGRSTHKEAMRLLMFNLKVDGHSPLPSEIMPLHRYPYSRHREMATSKKYILVLWGDYFDEYMAVSFITHFREAGLCVKVVGFHSQRAEGMLGVALYTDISLDEATKFMEQVRYVVLPCPAYRLKTLADDPRMVDFMRSASTHNVQLILGSFDDVDLSQMDLFTINLTNVKVAKLIKEQSPRIC